MLKKLLAGLSTVVLALGMVVLTSAPASAHTPSIKADCQKLTVDLKSYKSWHNGDSTPNTVTVTIDGTVVQTAEFGESFWKQYSFTQGASSHTYRVQITTPDGYNLDTGTKTVSGCTVTVKPVKPTFNAAQCIAGAPGKASYVIPSITGVQYQVKNGGTWVNISAGTHYVDADADVRIRAVEKSGYELEGDDSKYEWTHDFTKPNCAIDVKPTKPTSTDGVCVAEGQVGNGTITIPAITGVKYQVYSNGSWVDIASGPHQYSVGTELWIRAVELPGYELEGDDSKYKWNIVIKGPYSSKCEVAAAPTFADSVCLTEPGSSTQAKYTIPSDDHIQYQIWNGSSWVNINAGTVNVDSFPTTVEIRAIATGAHVLVPGSTAQWTHTFTSPGDCLVVVTPVTPQWDDAECHPDTTGTTTSSYFITSVPNISYTVSTDNVTFSPATTDTWVEVPAGTHVWVKATADTGYKITTLSAWDHQFPNPGECLDEAVPADPEFVDSTCVEDGPGATQATYEIVAAEGVMYEISFDGVTYTSVGAEPGVHNASSGSHIWIRAIPLDGYTLTGTTEWDHAFGDPGDCLDEAPVGAVTGADQQCIIDGDGKGSFVSGYITIPNTPNVSYFIDGAPAAAGDHDRNPGSYVVTAVAADGYQLVGYPDGGWTIEIEEAELCGDLVTKPLITPAVVFTQSTCAADGSFTLSTAEGTPGAVIWTVNGQPASEGATKVTGAATVKVVAVPADGYGFAGQVPQLEWEFQFNARGVCGDLETLALTGGTIAGGVTLAGLLVMAGALGLMLRRRQQVSPEA